MYLVHTPQYLQALFPGLTWKMPSAAKEIYLTFDDGPIPEVTPWVLSTLDEYDAKATFFCVGDNVRKYPDIYERIIEDGHSVGNHTLNHLSGWATENISYFHNIRHCARMVHSGLFRPPYGKLRPSQIQFLQRHYHIIMWDVLSADFDNDISPEDCFQNVIQHAVPGSIVVFHDSLKAETNLRFALPMVLDHFSKQGYVFRALKSDQPMKSERRLKVAV
ncbi:MAG TPA: polysaccharide deacetylase family protein [Saprospiraceae bacterium]|nr:polysaccharide deacetylase family protein [Saprospiraceae bacterium]